MAATQGAGLSWLIFALSTVLCWGGYGVLLHSGQAAMNDPAQGRYKAFLLVGVAYFLTAVLAPLFVLIRNGATWDFPVQGIQWSFLAGIVGAAGAFCVLLAFRSRRVAQRCDGDRFCRSTYRQRPGGPEPPSPGRRVGRVYAGSLLPESCWRPWGGSW